MKRIDYQEMSENFTASCEEIKPGHSDGIDALAAGMTAFENMAVEARRKALDFERAIVRKCIETNSVEFLTLDKRAIRREFG